MKIGIIIPFYNGHPYLDRLVESFDRAALGYECTMLIIDNSPGDQSVRLAYQSAMPVEIIKEKPGLGFGRANNRGYRVCKERGYDYVIVSNQDGYVSENFIREILIPFQQDNKIQLVAPLLKMYDQNGMEDFFIKYYVSQVPGMVSDLINGKAKTFYEMTQISGACFAFKLTNSFYPYPYFFDPLFHMYYEDEDLCHRVLQAGGKIVLVSSDAVFYHQHAHTTDTENRETIETDKLVSEKILRLKNGSKSSAKILYGIWVTTTSNFIYHLLRGEFGKAFKQLRSFMVILFKLPAILKSRNMDLAIISGKA